MIERWEAAKLLNDRGLRPDDADPEVFQTRINEYREKTLPVLKHYQELGASCAGPSERTARSGIPECSRSVGEFCEPNALARVGIGK